LGNGHQIKCHLAEDILARMDPVIALANDNAKPRKAAKKVAKKAARKVAGKTAKKAAKKAAKKFAKKRA